MCSEDLKENEKVTEITEEKKISNSGEGQKEKSAEKRKRLVQADGFLSDLGQKLC